MRKIFQIFFAILCCKAAVAQIIPAGEKTVYFIKTGKDTSSPAGYWLVKTKEYANAALLLQGRPFTMVRQISGHDFIVHSLNNKEAPSHPLFLSVQPANSNWKLSPYLLNKLLAGIMHNDSLYSFEVQTSAPAMLIDKLPPLSVLYAYEDVLTVRISFYEAKKILLPDESITFITIADRTPKEEININGFDNSLNKINKVHSDYPALNGSGIVVSVKENKPDTTDIDFKGRFVPTAISGSGISSHATIMATIIAGAGNSFYTGKGVACNADISSSAFAILLPDNDAAYQQYKISVQNHSYGTGIENFYGADAAAYDASVNNNPALLHVFSSGNSGNQASSTGQYNGINGFANLTGSFKMSKNSISVGSVDSFGTIPLLSSKGPAYDGRIKPELTAFGEDGSSGAAALVSGTAMLLQQSYKERHGNNQPDAALVKAVLLNSADDAGNKGIDFSAGFGSLNASRAVETMQNERFFAGSVGQSASQSFTITLPANTKQLKLLLAWTDKPAAANAFTALVNDLDLTLLHTATSQTWQPWVLNSYANKDSLQLLPVRKRDSLNNVEQITVDDPPAGNYTITVNGFRIAAGMQTFYIAYQWDSVNTFQWSYPSASDNLAPGRQNTLRWQNNYTGNGVTEYKWAGTNTWQLIDASVPLTSQYYKWMPPDTSAVAQLKMTVNGQSYISDSFTVSPRTETGVGFNCPDSFLLYWNKSPAGKYILYHLGSQYMDQLTTVTDTSIIPGKTVNTATWYAVAPLLPFGKTALRSFAFNYTQQGVACYIKTFIADFINNIAQLKLDLGTVYQLKRITIEKKQSAGYTALQTYFPPLTLQYTLTDAGLTRGLNTYRVKIELANGTVIYSNDETVYFFGNRKYIVYPNPVKQQQSIHIIAAELNNPVFTLFNAYGQKVLEKILFNLSEEIPTGTLPKGIYFYSIYKNGGREEAGRIVVF